MSTHSQEKTKQLGLNFSTACGRLRKILLFSLAVELNRNVCYRCNRLIGSVDDFTIDHIIPWMYSEKPNELFFDIDNIAFSHGTCNSSHSRGQFNVKSQQGFKGVYFDSRRNRAKPYYAEIWHDNKKKWLGFFATKEQAAIAYDKAATEIKKDKAVTNKMLGFLD